MPNPVVMTASRDDGGISTARVAAAATTNATSVKASPGQVYGLTLFNNAAAARFFKFYDKASAPVVGTDTPKWTVGLAASQRIDWELPAGVPFTLGIAYAIVTGIADSDATATAANDVHGALHYA